MINEHLRALRLVPDMRISTVISSICGSYGASCDLCGYVYRGIYEVHHAIETTHTCNSSLKATYHLSYVCRYCEIELTDCQHSTPITDIVKFRASMIGHQFTELCSHSAPCMICDRIDYTCYKHSQTMHVICTTCKMLSRRLLCAYQVLQRIIPRELGLYITVLMYDLI